MKKTILVLAAFFMAGTLWAQTEAETEEPRKGFQKDKVFVGGNFGLTFGDYTLVNISPQLGYRFTNFFAAGMGINGQYVSYKDRDFMGNAYRKVSQGVTGLMTFARVYPIPQLMLQVQPEANYIFGNQTFYGPPKEQYKLDAVIAPSLLLGGGAVMPAGERGAFIASIFYDVLQHKYTPYGKQPIYNFGYNVSLGR